MRKIIIELEDSEFIELAAIACCASLANRIEQMDNEEQQSFAFGGLCKKVQAACSEIATPPETEMLERLSKSILFVLDTPSIERGMAHAGLEELLKEVIKNFNDL